MFSSAGKAFTTFHFAGLPVWYSRRFHEQTFLADINKHGVYVQQHSVNLDESVFQS